MERQQDPNLLLYADIHIHAAPAKNRPHLRCIEATANWKYKTRPPHTHLSRQEHLQRPLQPLRQCQKLREWHPSRANLAWLPR
jgi:hypothetical protein